MTSRYMILKRILMPVEETAKVALLMPVSLFCPHKHGPFYHLVRIYVGLAVMLMNVDDSCRFPACRFPAW